MKINPERRERPRAGHRAPDRAAETSRAWAHTVRQAQAISTKTSRRTEKQFSLLLRNTIIREVECGLLRPQSNQVPDVCGQHWVGNGKDGKTPR